MKEPRDWRLSPSNDDWDSRFWLQEERESMQQQSEDDEPEEYEKDEEES